MKKPFLCILIILSLSPSLSFSQALSKYVDDYKWGLTTAMREGDLETIENIIKTNINKMSATDKKLVMYFAMIFTSGDNTLKVCQILFNYNIRPSAFDLYTAINANRQNDAIQSLLQNGAVPNGEILLLTMQKKRFDLARQFIEDGVDVNYRYSLTRDDADGMTALLYAAKWGNLEIVKLLVEKGANVNIKAVNGDTVLSIARRYNNDEVYNYLAEHGATEIGSSNIPLQNNGIAGSQVINFQGGAYLLAGGNKYIKFSGNKTSGSMNYVDVTNNISNNGFYKVTGNNITISLNGRTFVYKIDSNESFSGNGEVWTKIGN